MYGGAGAGVRPGGAGAVAVRGQRGGGHPAGLRPGGAPGLVVPPRRQGRRRVRGGPQSVQPPRPQVPPCTLAVCIFLLGPHVPFASDTFGDSFATKYIRNNSGTGAPNIYCDLSNLPHLDRTKVSVSGERSDERTGEVWCRLVEGVEVLARMLHPDLVHTRIADDLVRKITLSHGQRCRQSALASCFAAYT